MRSRYVAFARGDVGHLLRSWAIETRPARLELDPAQVWTGLQILETKAMDGGRAMVSFRARYAHPLGDGAVEERSRFRREADRWLYVDGAG